MPKRANSGFTHERSTVRDFGLASAGANNAASATPTSSVAATARREELTRGRRFMFQGHRSKGVVRDDNGRIVHQGRFRPQRSFARNTHQRGEKRHGIVHEISRHVLFGGE